MNRIKLNINASGKIEEVIKSFSEYIQKETLTTEINFSDDAGEDAISFEIDTHTFKIDFLKASGK